MTAPSSRRRFLGLIPIAASAVVVPASAVLGRVADSAPRLFEVTSLNMALTLRPGLDSIVTKVVGGYAGRGIYAFNVAGVIKIYRATRHDGVVHLMSDSFADDFPTLKVTDAWFSDRVLGKATGILTHLGRAEPP